MTLCRFGLTLALVTLGASSAAAQRPAVTVDDDDITIRGCITQARPLPNVAPTTLMWSRSDIMLSAAEMSAPAAAAGVFYWLDDDDDNDLSKHVGQRIEIKGELEDFEKGEVEIEEDGEFTEIELDLDGQKETARVPTSWLGPGAPRRDREFDIVARRIDVKDVRVLGACGIR